MVTRLAVAGHATAGWVSHFLTTPAWRRIKLVADRVLLFAVIAAIGWAATNGVFVARRAMDARGQALVHLDGLPTVKLAAISGKSPAATAPPTVVLGGMRSDRISIDIANDGTDGVMLKGGKLTGPYFAGAVKLVPGNHGSYIAGQGSRLLVGTVTVDCDAAAPVAHSLVAGRQGSPQPPTTVAVTVADTNGTVHTVVLPIDTTALAIQARVCTK